MLKRVIDRPTMGAEMAYAAQRNYPFHKLLNNLRRDYNIQPYDNSKCIKMLESNYNTLLFIVGERKQRYNNVG